MVPTREMLDTYFDELSHHDPLTEKLWFDTGIAAYCHLQSPASDDWKKQHGFPTSDKEGGNDGNSSL